MESTKESDLNPSKNFNDNLKNSNTKNSSFMKKCSIFDFKQSEKLLNEIVEVVEGFQHDFDLNVDNQSKKTSESREKFSLDSILSKKLSVSERLYCTSCNYTLTDRDEQV
jgi:hypothetical protein